MATILVQASEGVVGGRGQGVAGVQGSQHLFGCSPGLPGRVSGHKAQEGLLHLALSASERLCTTHAVRPIYPAQYPPIQLQSF